VDGILFPVEEGIFPIATSIVIILTLEITQPTIQPITYEDIKRPEREADHSPPSSAEVKNAWGYTSTPIIHLHGVVLS
jgi:hypothetical protein